MILIDEKWSTSNLILEVLTSKKIGKLALACVSQSFKCESPDTIIKLGTYLSLALSFKTQRSLELKEMLVDIIDKRQTINEDDYDVDIISTFDQMLAQSKTNAGII